MSAKQRGDDDLARLMDSVDGFAAEMKGRLARKWEEGRSGWDNPANGEGIYRELLARVSAIPLARGQEIDVANFAMMLWYQRRLSTAGRD